MPEEISSSRNVFILGLSSDIGRALAEKYIENGYTVFGTYRQDDFLATNFIDPGVKLFHCDISDKNSIKLAVEKYKRASSPWSIFISCIGSLEPIGSFFTGDFDEWEKSVIINSLAQLRFLHEIYPLREKNEISNAVFFAGGGTNSPFANYSAYCIAKILLIKICELLDDENPDLNAFIIGPGWVRTKIHKQTINNRLSSGSNFHKTMGFLNSQDKGTSYEDIYQCINWCISMGKDVTGGRNFSIVHDPWRNGGKQLEEQLRSDINKYKLRRYGNSSKSGGYFNG